MRIGTCTSSEIPGGATFRARATGFGRGRPSPCWSRLGRAAALPHRGVHGARRLLARGSPRAQRAQLALLRDRHVRASGGSRRPAHARLCPRRVRQLLQTGLAPALAQRRGVRALRVRAALLRPASTHAHQSARPRPRSSPLCLPNSHAELGVEVGLHPLVVRLGRSKARHPVYVPLQRNSPRLLAPAELCHVRKLRSESIDLFSVPLLHQGQPRLDVRVERASRASMRNRLTRPTRLLVGTRELAGSDLPMLLWRRQPLPAGFASLRVRLRRRATAPGLG